MKIGDCAYIKTIIASDTTSARYAFVVARGITTGMNVINYNVPISLGFRETLKWWLVVLLLLPGDLKDKMLLEMYLYFPCTRTC